MTDDRELTRPQRIVNLAWDAFVVLLALALAYGAGWLSAMMVVWSHRDF